jgi:hypothetical protein
LSIAVELHKLLLGYLERKQNLIIYMPDVRRIDSTGAATLLDMYAIARGAEPGFRWSRSAAMPGTPSACAVWTEFYRCLCVWGMQRNTC